MQKKFKDNLKFVTDACKFEHWLRFYFCKEDNQKLYLKLSEELRTHLKKNYPELNKLALELSAQEITPEFSQRTLIQFISKEMEELGIKEQLIFSVLNSKSFEVEMGVFHLWVQAHEDQLDEKVFDFQDWMQMFEAWKRTEKGQHLLLSLGSPNISGNDKTH